MKGMYHREVMFSVQEFLMIGISRIISLKISLLMTGISERSVHIIMEIFKIVYRVFIN